ncbi:MAG: nickel-responsive transcriptional regulator NikR [Deltaproteobacteria bacterium]|nr:nickel-responsive transcriptional regulator NikR [Deltaproteobacteria bacterium]
MLKRFSVSLEENLLEDFDEFIDHRQYGNRSEAIRDLIRKTLIAKEWQADKQVMGVISLVYDHHQHKLQEKITEEQHAFHHQIVASTHVHMDHDNCMEVIIVRGMEVIIVRGNADEVKNLADKLIALRGVRDGNLAMSSTGKDLH